jgi:hypothetical protein
MKILNFLTIPCFPTQLMRDVRELRRIVEAMDVGSRKALAKIKTAFNAEDTMNPSGTVCGSGDKPSSQVKNLMDIMRKFYK